MPLCATGETGNASLKEQRDLDQGVCPITWATDACLRKRNLLVFGASATTRSEITYTSQETAKGHSVRMPYCGKKQGRACGLGQALPPHILALILEREGGKLMHHPTLYEATVNSWAKISSLTHKLYLL